MSRPSDMIEPLLALTKAGIPTDIQELLIAGDPMRGIAPGALARALIAAEQRAYEDAARVAEAHRTGEQLIRHKMSQVDHVGVVSTTIASAIRAKAEAVK